MFEYLQKHRQILVSGPQRSGTRIASKMIAADLGYNYVDECDFHEENLEELQNILREQSRCVVQCPALSYCIHSFAEEIAVVFMFRMIRSIKKSEKRIGWACEWHELEKYRAPVVPGTIARLKYECWNDVQIPLIKFPYEVQYERLQEHPLFVQSEDRKNFRWNQTELTELVV